MAYEAIDFNYLLGMPGFSETLIKNHISLYDGYVKHTNKAIDSLTRLAKENKTDTLEYQELKRHFGWEFDGMRLHEFYFSNLGGTGDSNEAGDLKAYITDQYGNFEAWEKDFRATGAVRSVGWTILYQDSLTGRLLNFWINEHDKGHPAGCMPILVMDLWEHAYMLDYGIKRAGYIDAFFHNINWPQAQTRVNFQLARMALPAV